MPSSRLNALTVDVEDYQSIMARDWLGRDILPSSAVVRNTRRFLDIFEEHNVHGTFFVLGEVAAAFPQLIRDIDGRGHELGVHGYSHRKVFKLTPDEFRQEITRTKTIIEDLVGKPVAGHRAPAFSIMPHTAWALDVLAELGFRYDSSVYPIAGRRYGWPGFPLDIHEMTLRSGLRLIEAPLSTLCILGKRLPACGGGYLRHFPAFLTLWAFRRIERMRPVIVYLHPYEIELSPPQPDTSHLDSTAARIFRRFHALQIHNRRTVENKLGQLLNRFKFAPLAEVIDDVLGQGATTMPS